MNAIPTNELLWSAGKAFVIALFLTPIFRDIFRSYEIVDKPGRRKVHAYPIPRIGGIPIAIAYGIALYTLQVPEAVLRHDVPVWALLSGAAVVFLTGLLDDFLNLRPAYKIAGQIVAATLVFAGGVNIESVADVSVPAWLSYPLTLLWLLLCTNALNLIDGLDGLCAGIGLLATLTFVGAALLHGNVALALFTVPLAGALLGFLCFNFNPATVFLGDSGALLIGFLLGCYGMVWTQKAATLLSITIPVLALSIPLLDVCLSILRRFLRNQPIFTADRGHIHHRLLDLGLSPRHAVLVLYLGASSAAMFALLLSSPYTGRYRNFILAGFCGLAWAAIRHLRYSEFGLAARFLFRGEFQRMLDRRVRLEQLAAALHMARTGDEIWGAVLEACREQGWTRVRWSGGAAAREQMFATEAPVWKFAVSLPGGESLEVEGSFDSRSRTADLIAFAETVSRALSEREPAGESVGGPMKEAEHAEPPAVARA